MRWSGKSQASPTSGAPKANGAGIAADPTLTSAWSLRLCWSLGEPSVLLSSQRAWRSALFRVQLRSSGLPLAGPSFVTPPCFAVRHRRSHRHPTLLRDCLLRVQAEALSRFQQPLVRAETNDTLAVSGSNIVCPHPKVLSYNYRQPVSRPYDDVASLLPQTSRFASSRNLHHTGSQTESGQSPPYLWFMKNS